MTHYLNEFVVHVDIETTFNYVSDFRHAGSWDPRVERAVRTDGDGPIGVGTVFELDTPGPLGPVSLPYRVVEHDPPNRVAFEGDTLIGSYRDQITFEAMGEGATRVRYDAEFDLKGVAKLGDPLFRLIFHRIGDDATERIPAAVERAAAQGDRPPRTDDPPTGGA